ncbi:Uncharacterized protein FWK35_00027176 [Aphis craccivora]|uniref:THAP-type domain-containing protein n=1 Tax=Aphis craccivora TaxID=307492 RepID=A0A6G0WD27_APHCR|nr:Uncharacterized protein FWK35_00027176 [Aphis craccivora]
MVRENKCCIKNCPGLHKSRFSIPERSFNKWQEAIGTLLTKRSRICGAHFSKNDIYDTWTSDEGLSQYSICLKRPRLKDGANTNENMNWNISYDINSSYISQICSVTLSNNNNVNMELYDLMLKNNYNIKLPSCWCQRIVEKQLVVTEKSELIVYVLEVMLSVEELEMLYPTSSATLIKPTILDVEKIISNLDKVYVCYGAALVSDFPNCKRLCFLLKRKNKRLMIGDKINIFFSPSKLKSLNKLRHTKRVVRQKAARAKTRILRLQNSLREIQNQMLMISEESLTEIVEKSGISQIQSDLIREIFDAAKLKNNKSRRYSENWMLLCLLFQIRRSLTYSGLEDFGGKIVNKVGSSEEADHGLVFLWQVLATNVIQPIAVFASRGPAILLLEDAGLQVHPLKDYVKWDHYCTVFNSDSKTMLKICPKITKAYIELNNLSKMKVKYATQIFSNSMAIGIRFYRDRKLIGLEDSLETKEFTLFLNNMLDALNRKFPAEGIKKHSKDLEVT